MNKEQYLLATTKFMENKLKSDKYHNNNSKSAVFTSIYEESDANTMLYSILTGSKAYGLDVDGSDEDYYMFYLPSKKDLLYKNYVPFEYINEEKNYSVKFKDIMDLVYLYKNSNIQIMELIYLNKTIYNGEGYLAELFDYLEKNKDELCVLNEIRLIESIYGNIYQRYLKCKADFEKGLEGYAKSYMHFYRYSKYLNLIERGESIYDGILYYGEEREYLIKYRTKTLSEGEDLINQMSEDIEKQKELKEKLLNLAKPFNTKKFYEFSGKIEECTSRLITEHVKF